MPVDSTIALKTQTPDSLHTLGSILNIAGGAQQLQQQRQQIGLTGIELQKANQANQERLNLQQFFSDPNNFQTNGMIDLDKVNAVVPKIAPYTGAKAIDTLTQLSNAQTTAENAKLNFTTNERNIVGGLYGVLGRAGVDDPKIVDAELDRLKTQYPNNKTLSTYIDSSKVGLSQLPAGKDILRRTLITQSQALLGPAEQQASLTPTAAPIAMGSTVNPKITTPSVAGSAPTVSIGAPLAPVTVSPSERQNFSTDALGRPMVVTKTPTGQIGYEAPPGASYRPLVALPTGETAQTGQQLLLQRQAAQDAAMAAPQSHFNNQQILHLAPEAFTGTGSPELAKVMNAVGIQNVTGDAAKDTARLQHFLALQVEQNARTMGASTDQARELAANAVLPAHSPAEAIKNITKINDAMVTGNQLYYQGLKAAIDSPTNIKDIFASRDFQASWAKNFDPNAMRLYNAKVNNDQAEAASIVKELGGVNSPAFKTLVRKMHNIEELSRGQIP